MYSNVWSIIWTTVDIQWDIYVQCGRQMCSGSYDHYVKYMYTNAPGNIIDSQSSYDVYILT